MRRLLTLAALATIAGGWFGPAAGSEPVGRDELRRPLRLPVLRPGAACPRTPAGRADPLLIRGGRIDARGALRFGVDGRVLRELEMPPTSVGERRYGVSSTLVRGPGCYALQIDGSTFTLVVVFEAVLAPDGPAPPGLRQAVPGEIEAWLEADLLPRPGGEWAVAYRRGKKGSCGFRWLRAGLPGFRTGRPTSATPGHMAVNVLVTPSIGEHTWIFRVERRLQLLHSFSADRIRAVDLDRDGRSEIVLRWIHPARSPDGKTVEQAWRWERGAYRLWRIRPR